MGESGNAGDSGEFDDSGDFDEFDTCKHAFRMGGNLGLNFKLTADICKVACMV